MNQDLEKTSVLPQQPGSTARTAGEISRESGHEASSRDVEHTAVMPRPDLVGPGSTPVSSSADADRERREQREARQRALGVRSSSYHDDTPLIAPPKPKRTTDKWHGSLAFFLLRLVTAAIVGLAGYQQLMERSATEAYFAHSRLPQPGLFALIVPIAELVIAALLVLGLLTRVAGLALLVIEVGLLVFFLWGKGQVLVPGQPGFVGEQELLLAALGLTFLLLGAGGLAIDRAFRRNRARKRQLRDLGDTV